MSTKVFYRHHFIQLSGRSRRLLINSRFKKHDVREASSTGVRSDKQKNDDVKSNNRSPVDSSEQNLSSTSVSSATVAAQHDVDKKIEPGYNSINSDRLGRMMQWYEDFVGLTEVKVAQDKVVNAEQKFLQVQEDRRALQHEVLVVQTEVRTIGAELEKTSRTDSRYIDLVKKEHEILLIEKDMSNKIKALDKSERDFFSLLSAAVRESHEKERARAEKTKYWSIIGSVVGAITGIVGSTINNHRRMKEMRAIITESGETSAEYKAIAEKLLEQISSEQIVKEELARDPVNSEGVQIVNSSKPLESLVNRHEFQEQTDAILHKMEEQSNALTSSMKEIHSLFSIREASATDKNIIYVGPEMEEMMTRMEINLQKEGRRSTLLSTAAVGIIVSLGVGVLIRFISGPS